MFQDPRICLYFYILLFLLYGPAESIKESYIFLLIKTSSGRLTGILGSFESQSQREILGSHVLW